MMKFSEMVRMCAQGECSISLLNTVGTWFKRLKRDENKEFLWSVVFHGILEVDKGDIYQNF